MTKLNEHFLSYAQYHTTKGNKLTHYLGIPMILFSVLGLLSKLHVNEWLTGGLIIWLASTIFYIRLEPKRGILFSILTLALYWLSLFVTTEIHWSLFVGGWILQGIGHYMYEKKSPAFLTNITHLMIGPFWIFCNFVGGTQTKS